MVVSFDSSKLILQVHSSFLKDKLEINYMSNICAYLTKQHQKPILVELLVGEQKPMTEVQSEATTFTNFAKPENAITSPEKKERKPDPSVTETTEQLTAPNLKSKD